MVVFGGQVEGARFVLFHAVEAGGEDGLHRSVAEATAVALLGVGPGLEESLDEGGGVRSDPSAPGDQPRRAPVGVVAVRGGHVGGVGRVGALAAPAEVDGDAPVPVEDLDRGGGEPDIDLAAGQGVGDAVEAAVSLDVVVDVDAGPAPLGVLIAPRGQRPERRTVQILEPARPAAGCLLERPLVERGHKGRDGTSEFAEREERLVAQRR